ncbi:hypothetical protein BOTBODRAFT_498620 [Botryobasidium botryosum FD-172 SS1]|uniref:Knr4/Smi1-like domain-containing protein n=1 Tax=Botryobasidium botryosum (strain FD-172 SS1) TaxID=930990 RepID=A0A067M310_BOTB1|nr:hypothetical protein BOTBODRAFT_498620 [Botryobasidium botryosum FD-172 SS1]
MDGAPHPHSLFSVRNPRGFALRLTRTPSEILHAITESRAIWLAVRVALDLSVEGYLNESADVLSALWASNPSSQFNNTRIKLGLELIWSTTNFRPRGRLWLPSTPALLATLEIKVREAICPVSSEEDVERCRADAMANPTPTAQWELIRALAGVRIVDQEIRMPRRASEVEALDLLDQYLALPPTSSDGPDHALVLTLAVELSLKHGRIPNARTYMDYVGARIADGVLDETLKISQAPRAGPLFLEGIIARRTGLTLEQAQQYAKDVGEALKVRVGEGEQRPFRNLTMHGLLQTLESKERFITPVMPGEQVLPFFSPPATPQQIAQVEIRLGVMLPMDYKEFLMITNGLGSYCPFGWYSALAPVEEIYWDDMTPTEYRLRYRPLEDHETDDALPFIRRALHISSNALDDTQRFWLIEPELVAEAKVALGDPAIAGEWVLMRWGDMFPSGFDDNAGTFRMVMERRLVDMGLQGY